MAILGFLAFAIVYVSACAVLNYFKVGTSGCLCVGCILGIILQALTVM